MNMNNKIIGSIIVCAFLIVTVLPAGGLASQPGQTARLKTKLSFLEEAPRPTAPPGPGEMARPYPLFDALKTAGISYSPRDASLSQTNDFIINLIQQVNQSVVLGYLQNLTAFGPRLTGSTACQAAAVYIYNQFIDMGLAVRYDNWSYSGYSGSNIEATLPGTDVNSDEIFLICGHYDSVAAGPGADDDGSGTVATITAASIMSKYSFNTTIRFVTFSGEEQGLLGSAAYAAEASENGDNIIGVLNADMISYAVTSSDGNHLKIYENTPSEWLYTFIVNIENLYHQYINLSLIHSGYIWGSDHNSFWDQGYNAIFTFEFNETPYYHTSGDTIAHLNISYGVKNTKLLIATLAELTAPSGESNPPDTPMITGSILGGINTAYVYTLMTTDPDGDPVSYFIDWGDNTSSGWLGPYSSGASVQASHTWASPGTYVVRARARDIFHANSNWSVPLTVVILNDHPPSSPTILGETHGLKGINYLYKILATDPDGDDISYYIDWGDNTSTGWLGPYTSGTHLEIRHRWTIEGSYTIRAKAKDSYDLESSWATLPISMPALSQESLQLSFNQITILSNKQLVLTNT
jgi:hypothetical protein